MYYHVITMDEASWRLHSMDLGLEVDPKESLQRDVITFFSEATITGGSIMK